MGSGREKCGGWSKSIRCIAYLPHVPNAMVLFRATGSIKCHGVYQVPGGLPSARVKTLVKIG
jgi:hypothetical protein